MKKLVYLLVLSLCINGLAGAALPCLSSASAASKTEEKAEEKSAKKSKKKKAEKTSKDESGKSDKKEKKTKVEKEKEYALDLAKNNRVALSDVLKYTKMDIKLKDVKSIELVDKKDKKRIRWEKDEDNNKDDYIITVLKDFDELKLRIVTKKTSRLLVLKNGAKDAEKGEEKAERGDQADAEATKAPSEEKQEKPVEEIREAEEAPAEQAEAAKEAEKAPAEQAEEAKKAEKAPAEQAEEAPSDEKQEAPVGDGPEKDDTEATEPPAQEQAEKAAEEDTEAPAGERHAESAEATEAAEQDRTEEEKQTEVEKDGEAEPQTGDEETGLEEPTSPVTESAMEDAEDLSDSSQEPGASEAGEQAGNAEAQGDNTEAQGGNTEAQGGNTEAQGGSAEGQAEYTEAQGESGEGQGAPEGGQTATGGEQGDPGEGQTAPAEAQDEGAADQGEPGGDQAEAGEEDGAGTADGEQGEAPADSDGSGDEAPQSETGASIPGEAEAWFKRGAELLWGPLDALIAQLTGGETVYIQTDKLMLIREAPTQVLSTVTLLPDGDVFKGSYSVRLSTDNPTLVAEPAPLQPADLPALGDVADLYVWVKPDEEPSAEDEEQGDEESPTLVVTATGFEPSGWSKTQPQFTLSGIPEGKDWSYAAIIYDERIVPFASNVYVPEEEGIFTLRFAMLNAIGDIMAASEQYTLQLDWTAPEVSIEVDEETSYTLNISAVDRASGLDAVSVDKGKTWQPIDEEGYTVTETAEKTFKAGAIRVRDVAGNVYKSEEEYTVKAVEDEEGEGDEGGEGGGGGGGGGGSGTPALPHSRGDGEEGADYDALMLELPDAPMERLTVGGEPMALTLTLASAQESSAPVGANQPFTGRLCHWKDASNSDGANTLLLEAEMADDLGDVFTYEWHFNGEVYRMLANSGIKYLALKVADTVAAFPTEGFTGGTRYTELKMQGVSTRKFDYTLTMKLNLDPSHVSAMTESDYSQECDLSIHTVVEETNYELSNSPQSMMYFYNVFLGPEDMMDQPFGEYRANA